MKPNQIVLIHGTDYADMTMRLLESIGLEEIIGDKAARVAVKPNLVIADTADRGAVTHPQIVDGVLRFLACEHAFEVCGLSLEIAGMLNQIPTVARTTKKKAVCGIRN